MTGMFAEQNVHHLPPSMILSMTPEERMQALQDLHGVLDVLEETPEIVEEKLGEMDDALNAIDSSLRGPYDEAVRLNQSYVRAFRLAFLRTEAFDPTKAAQRMVAHFAMRLELFQSSDVLGRDVTISDLSSRREDIPFIQMSTMQLLKYRDRVGRPIILFYPGALSSATYPFPPLVGTCG